MDEDELSCEMNGVGRLGPLVLAEVSGKEKKRGEDSNRGVEL
jgi:hypothetical protein